MKGVGFMAVIKIKSIKKKIYKLLLIMQKMEIKQKMVF